MAEPSNPGSIPIGGIYAAVEIDTGSVRPDMQALHDILKKVSDQVDQLSASMKGATTATQADADATNVYAVEASVGMSAAQMFAKANFGVAQAVTQATAATQANTVATKANTAAAQANAAAQVSGASASRKFQYGLIQVAYVMDDMQYGMKALTNNVAALASSVGGPYAGAIAIAGTAGMILYNNWDKLNQIFIEWGHGSVKVYDQLEKLGLGAKTGSEKIEHLKDQLAEAKKVTDELGSHTHLTADQFVKYKEGRQKVEELTEALKELQAVEDLRSGMSKKQAARAAGFKEAFTEDEDRQGEADLIKALRSQADAKGMVTSGIGGTGTPEQVAQKLFAQALKGDKSAIQEIQSSIRGEYGGRDTKFTKGIDEFSPEAVEKKKEAEKNKKAEHALNESVRKDEEALVDKISQSLEQGIIDALAKGETPDAAWIQKRIEETGFANKVTPVMFQGILNTLNKNMAQKHGFQALAEGGNQADAANRAIDAARDRQERKEVKGDETPLEKQARLAREDARKKREQSLKRIVSRAAPEIQKEMERRKRAGKADWEVKADATQKLFQEYKRQGWSDQDAMDAAEAVADESEDRMKGKAAGANAARGMRMQPGAAAGARINPGAGNNQAQLDKNLAKDIGKEVAAALEPKLKPIADNTKQMTNGAPAIIT